MGEQKIEKLLDTKISDLKVSIKNSYFHELIKQLNYELKLKSIHFKPTIWISDEWFSPDGSAGFAIPFWLLTPELQALEKHMIGYCEGEGTDWSMKLLRHECAHALDNAFHLRKSKKRQSLFGLTSKRYPESYFPNPESKNFVKHLDTFYAQAHPDEDWAETFAVWLDPVSQWKNIYKDWPALKKLNLLDEILTKIQKKDPITDNVFQMNLIKSDHRTLREFYKHRINTLNNCSIINDKNINSLFIAKSYSTKYTDEYQRQLTALKVSRKLKNNPFITHQIIENLSISLKRNKLVPRDSFQKNIKQLTILLEQNTKQYLKKGYHRVLM